MTIKRKLILMMTGVTVAAVLLTVGAVTAYLIYDMQRGKAQELRVTATITGDRNSAALLFLDSAQLVRNLEIFRSKPAILAACVYDAQGMLFAGYPDDSPNPPCPTTADALQMRAPGMLTALEPVRQKGEIVGSIFLKADTSEIDAYIEKVLLIGGTAGMLVLGVIILPTLYLQRTISRPIQHLAQTAQAITAHRDYTLEADIASQDETGDLARAFNEMIGEVRKRDEELQEANHTLERKVTERTHQLEVAKCKAEMASEAKSEFLRNMSHEFRTPLHAIISFSAYGIKEHEKAERTQLQQYFTLIQKGAERLSRLVNEVLDLAKLEHGEHLFTLKRGDMNDIATRSVEMVRSLMEEKGLTPVFDFATGPSPVVCDQDKLVQVLTNLLSNAVKFTPAGRNITLHTRSEPVDGKNQVLVSVIDEGVGIPEEEKEMIFESFRQSSRTNNGAGGTGLGLAICRGIIQGHGGRIWAENNADRPGARVSFALPVTQQEGQRLITIQPTEDTHADAA